MDERQAAELERVAAEGRVAAARAEAEVAAQQLLEKLKGQLEQQLEEARGAAAAERAAAESAWAARLETAEAAWKSKFEGAQVGVCFFTFCGAFVGR